ncbi:MAG: rhodanese-like domain-containing protein [Candidatus Omnitrophica bacterium]|nr:rhodanese-like domain-containing protein [Candidatus Omnitrophota bacterium]
MMLRRAAVLLILPAVLGGLANSFHPNKIPWVGNWERYVESEAVEAGLGVASIERAREIVAGRRWMILDARTPKEYEAGHLPGALSLPRLEFEEKYEKVEVFLSRREPLLVYCSDKLCDEAVLLAKRLKDQGYTQVWVFVGGFKAWETAGHPVEGAK